MSEPSLFKKLKEDMFRDGTLKAGLRYVLGVSGGPDSVFLFRFFLYLKKTIPLEFSVAHFDHMMRKESENDMRFCAELCNRYSIAFHFKQEDIPKERADSGRSLEEYARERRHLFFEEVRSSQQADLIALGHHRNDQMETFFFRACRGCGLEGLAGIRPKRDKVIHPLLRIGRGEIIATLAGLGQEYVHDLSNGDTTQSRNFFRMEILPLIMSRFNQADQSVSRLCEILQEEDRIMDLLAKQGMEKCVSRIGKTAKIKIKEFKKLDLGIRRRILVKLLPDPRFDLVERILNALEHSPYPPTHIIVERGLIVTRQGQELHFDDKMPIQTGGFRLLLDISGSQGTVEIPRTEYRLSWEKGHSYTGTYQPNEVRINLDALKSPLELRTRIPGDRIRALGMVGHAKVKKLMMEKRIPRDMRDRIPLLVSGDEVKVIFFNFANSSLFNYISQDMCVFPETRNMLRIVLEKGVS